MPGEVFLETRSIRGNSSCLDLWAAASCRSHLHVVSNGPLKEIAMAVNAYLIIDGRPGPSTSKTDAIDILSFSFGASQTAVIGVGSSGGEARAGRANLNDITIMKVVDKGSPL